jgi:hypothetical protein
MPNYLKAPLGCSGGGIGNAEFVVDEDGIAEIPDGVDHLSLLDHGFSDRFTESDLAKVRIKKAKRGAPDASEKKAETQGDLK